MDFYIYLALVVFLLSIIKVANTKTVYVVSCCVLFFLAAYRSIGVGTDSRAYYTIYYLFANNASYVASNSSYKNIEFIWMALLQFFRNLSDYRGLLVSLEVLIAVPLFYSLQKQSRWPLFSLLLYIVLYYYGTSMNAMRQSVAMSFFLLAIPYLESEKKKYWLLMALATAIHSSAIFVFVLVWLIKKMNLDFNRKVKYTIVILVSFVIGMFFTAMFKELLIPFSKLFAFNNYDLYLSGGNVNEKRNLFNNLGLNLLAVFLLHKNKDANSIYFKLYLIGVIMTNLVAGLGEVSARISIYFSMMQIVAFPNFLASIENSFKKSFYIVLIAVYGFSLYYYYLSKNVGEIIPYSNVYINL